MSIRLLIASLLIQVSVVCAEATVKPGTVIRDCPDCPALVVVPPGSYMMGEQGDLKRVPVHQVRLAYSFAIGQTEVTEAQFRYFLQRTGYDAGPAHTGANFTPNLPAVQVDWYAATAYVRWLSRHTGKHYRLPSEAEWEYAARAGTTTRYWWGDRAADGCGMEQLPDTFFPYDAPCASALKQESGIVASKQPNPWGLYDMMGNVGEWMLDCPPVEFSDYKGAPQDGSPYGGCSQFSTQYTLRGPSFINQSSPRHRKEPGKRTSDIGFRVVRELP